jgi:hypothetical protein
MLLHQSLLPMSFSAGRNQVVRNILWEWIDVQPSFMKESPDESQ